MKVEANRHVEVDFKEIKVPNLFWYKGVLFIKCLHDGYVYGLNTMSGETEEFPPELKVDPLEGKAVFEND